MKELMSADAESTACNAKTCRAPGRCNASNSFERRRRSRWFAGLVAAAAFGLTIPIAALAQQAPKEQMLKVAMHSDLKIFDPIWTTAYITRNHGYMVYDTLFATDEKGEIQPQMVDSWQVSDDKLAWTFRLRDGLKFHDGAPVTPGDVIASLERWASKDAMGQKLWTFVKDASAVDAKTFRLSLHKPTGLMLLALGKPSSLVPFIMPKRIAATSANDQIKETIGSGPFVYSPSESKPGVVTVYTKFADYQPRSEPPSGLAGGKVVKIDRVEWRWIPDTQTQLNALQAGEIDVIEQPPFDLMPTIEKDDRLALVNFNPLGYQSTFRFNVLHKPFDNVKIRQALFHAFNQEDFMKATVGNPKYYRVCKEVFICGSPFGSMKGMEDKLESNFKQARALLKEGGYDGTPVVLMQSTDLAVLTNLAPVAKSLMERAGFKVDMQSMDWQTVVARRTKKDPPSTGGWSAFLTNWVAADQLNPVGTAFYNASCDKAMFGWPCDEKTEQIRDAFANETDPARQKAIAEEAQVRLYDYPSYVHLGQFVFPAAVNKAWTGVLSSPVLVFWNVSKGG